MRHRARRSQRDLRAGVHQDRPGADLGASFFLPRLVGEARARALAMLGEAVNVERAEAWGMIWRAVDDATLQSDAETLTTRLATQPTAALAK